MLNGLVVSVSKPVIHKLKILGEGKLEYYKSMGGTMKRQEPNFEISVRGSKKRGGSNLVGGVSWLRRPKTNIGNQKKGHISLGDQQSYYLQVF